jgi:hypothetical protein
VGSIRTLTAKLHAGTHWAAENSACGHVPLDSNVTGPCQNVARKPCGISVPADQTNALMQKLRGSN